jgi:hypothetical protein
MIFLREATMKLSMIFVGLGLAVCSGGWAQAPSGRLELSTEFAAVRAKIAPRPEEELWKRIPWKTSLLEARYTAAKEGKPIFLWSMDGHPLCLG